MPAEAGTDLDPAAPAPGIDECTSNSGSLELATGQSGASAIAVDDTSVYWSTNFANDPSRLMKVPLRGAWTDLGDRPRRHQPLLHER
jgi:hypothetical protein